MSHLCSFRILGYFELYRRPVGGVTSVRSVSSLRFRGSGSGTRNPEPGTNSNPKPQTPDLCIHFQGQTLYSKRSWVPGSRFRSRIKSEHCKSPWPESGLGFRYKRLKPCHVYRGTLINATEERNDSWYQQRERSRTEKPGYQSRARADRRPIGATI